MRLDSLWISVLLLALLASVDACAPLRSHPIPSSPLFSLDPRDAQRYQALAREQDATLDACAETHICDRAHFTRALVALYEDQTVAAKHFQDVMAVAPKSRLAASSQFWLHLLQNPPIFFVQHSAFAEATDRLVRDLLDLEFSSTLVLQREVRTRDKRVEELTQQLDALKRIDQEMNEKSRPTRPPTRMQSPADKDSRP
jgi:hypothetical protein